VQCGAGGSPSLSDRPGRYGMILLDTAPAPLRVSGGRPHFIAAFLVR
jgi:hypothetical protein